MRTLVDELRERPARELIPDAVEEVVNATAPVAPPAPVHPEELPLRVLIVPVKTAADELAGGMLAHLFMLGGVGSKTLSHKALANEVLDSVAADEVGIVCPSLVRPFAVMQARYLTKRLRTRFPQIKILIGLWDSKRLSVGSHRNLQTVHADWVVTSLGEALSEVCPLAHCLPNPAFEGTPKAALQVAQVVPAV